MFPLYASQSIKTPDSRSQFAILRSLQWNFLPQNFALVFMWVMWVSSCQFDYKKNWCKQYWLVIQDQHLEYTLVT